MVRRTCANPLRRRAVALWEPRRLGRGVVYLHGEAACGQTVAPAQRRLAAEGITGFVVEYITEYTLDWRRDEAAIAARHVAGVEICNLAERPVRRHGTAACRGLVLLHVLGLRTVSTVLRRA